MTSMGRRLDSCALTKVNVVVLPEFPVAVLVTGVVLGGCHVLLLLEPPLHQELGVVSVL